MSGCGTSLKRSGIFKTELVVHSVPQFPFAAEVTLRGLNRSVARWRQDGERKARMLGRTSQMTKAQAQSELATLVGPINNGRSELSDQKSFGDFVRDVYLPFYRRKWKLNCDDQRGSSGTSEFNTRPVGTFERDELQGLLDRKGQTLSFSVVDHLRWDLNQIFDMAVAEGYLRRSRAALLFTQGMQTGGATRVQWNRCDCCFRC